jgi:8-amino-7-oxononanoate synthase
MGDLFQKCFDFQDAKAARASGFYPYFREIEESEGTEVVVDGRRLLMLGSNNYLGLTHHPKVREAAADALWRFGPGCTGSRFLNGTLGLHVTLEGRLADFLEKESALCFSTGFQTNLGTVATLTGRQDFVYGDRANHASLLEGVQLSGATYRRYRHNDAADLERRIGADHARRGNGSAPGGRLVMTDGVFSMEGDIAPLPEIVRIKKRYGARLLVDDAHGIGVMGPGGRGTAHHFGLADEVDLVMGTFSKSFASLGGVIAGPFDVIDFIKHKARAMIFSASMPPASTATVIACLDVLAAEPERLDRLWRNADRLRRGLKGLGFDTGDSATPIVPIYIGDEMKCFVFWRALNDAGVFTNPVVTPATPPGRALIRTSVMATHTRADIDRALEIFDRVGRQLELSGSAA